MAYIAASLRGWGAGWPAGVPASALRQVDINGTRFPGGVRADIAKLVSLLVAECQRRGYGFGIAGDPAYGCWGYSNRPIAGTKTASNHSWGLAVDINAPRNPQRSPLTTDMPAWMPALWKAHGFRWGGDYSGATPDPMHFEFMGTPADAARFTAIAAALDMEDDVSASEVWDYPLPVQSGLGPAAARLWLQDTLVALTELRKQVADLAARPAVSVDAAAVAKALAADPAFLAGVAKAVNDDAAARLKS